jgi:dCTP deaminase
MDPQDFQDIRPGVLNQKQVSELKDKVVHGLDDQGIDLSAFDLHLSQEGWEMQASMKPLSREDISKITKEHGKHLQGEGPWELNREGTYIFQLREYLTLQKGHMFQCQATGKSSIGRLDVLSRLMVNKCAAFDTIEDDGYEGSLYLEVTPITFPIKVKEGLALAQLRLFRGKPEWTELKPKEGLQLYGAMILDEDGQPKTGNTSDLTVNLSPDEKGFIAFRTKDKEEIKDKKLVVDLTQGEESNDPTLFWEPEPVNKNNELEIIPERFYILRSKERFRLPRDVAVYCQAVSETLGELRIHYASFVHPGFGSERDKGTPIIFEVRGHNVKVRLRDGETLARVKFYRMSQDCSPECLKRKKTVYGDQELKLSKYFRDWGK